MKISDFDKLGTKFLRIRDNKFCATSWRLLHKLYCRSTSGQSTNYNDQFLNSCLGAFSINERSREAAAPTTHSVVRSTPSLNLNSIVKIKYYYYERLRLR